MWWKKFGTAITNSTNYEVLTKLFLPDTSLALISFWNPNVWNIYYNFQFWPDNLLCQFTYNFREKRVACGLLGSVVLLFAICSNYVTNARILNFNSQKIVSLGLLNNIWIIILLNFQIWQNKILIIILLNFQVWQKYFNSNKRSDRLAWMRG